MCDSSMADSASFSSLLKSVLTNNSSTVRFQGQYNTSQQEIMVSTKPRVSEAQFELPAECTNPSTNISSLAPATISISHSAPVIQKHLLTENIDRITSHPRIVMESPATDGYSWRKYGQKQVKSSRSFRSYYRCSHSNCHAKKKVQRCDQSGQVIDTVYIGQHNHDLSQNKCNISRGSASSAKLTASSHIVDSDNKVDNADVSICWEDGRQSSLHMTESEQQSSSSSNGNFGIKGEEQNGTELESSKFYCTSEIGHETKNSCGIAKAEVPEKHGAEPWPRKRKKESSVYLAPVLKATKDTNIVVHAADGAMSSDGFRWRKYGQKMVKANSYLRSYYRCTSAGCPSRKHVEMAIDDARTTTIKYEGKHDHDMPVPRKQKGSKSLVHNSPPANANAAHCKKTSNLSSQRFSSSTEWAVDREENMMDEKVLELGGEMALESAQTLLSIGTELRPC
ncbi:probable WRKY transcription factor 32 [Ricinus communis]|uniref:probable WRKY transcription factor 32 n=1 Tax=Ricinus communis TaxID=3988 RepID=UPI0007722471|nr:probable WRKY transcription factor 32 [Ricinus communis]|eukprot:XP_015572562.1 probable WRKY transcription factor 32 [Ricinus communis]